MPNTLKSSGGRRAYNVSVVTLISMVVIKVHKLLFVIRLVEKLGEDE